MAKEREIKNFVFERKGIHSTKTLDDYYVESHQKIKEDIYEHLLSKDITKYRAGIITNLIMNKAIYGVKYSKEVEMMINIALDISDD